ncbi:hypothetical protein vBCtySFA67_00049 [Clostridium phage vB_CtyS-FA67]|nr:hypothetical protein vBCtySFA67_00049 [Clostridium phage vB_CtyS-FA67]WMU08154.1 hypothetical protein vBCtySFA70_00050 [Clostridium phage vB_CtyS-FA70]
MRVEGLRVKGTWREVADACRTTVGKEAGTGEPSSQWKRRLLLSEHSPIRRLSITWKWVDLPYWVSVHLVRHKFGIEHWVSTQRTDRTGEDRREKSQDAPVTHEAEADVQALINISRKRLCNCAAPETREAWLRVKHEITKVEPEIASCMVRDCVYRGRCKEMFSCGYDKTPEFKKELEDYDKSN